MDDRAGSEPGVGQFPDSPAAEHAADTEGDRASFRSPLRTTWELLLIGAGICLLFTLTSHTLSADGRARFDDLSALLQHGELTPGKYSLIGSVFASPLWLLGSVSLSSEWWCARFNFFVVLLLSAGLYALFRGRIGCARARTFVAVLLFASMFPVHQMDFFGEVFSAALIGIGLAIVALRQSWWGWALAAVGGGNTPAAVPPLCLVGVVVACRERQWRHLLGPLLGVLLVLAECWIRRGSPFDTGYAGDQGFRTFMPYSGRPGFSYPLFFGVLSILFSFGKGLLFFAPGLTLAASRAVRSLESGVRFCLALWLVFLSGLILVYAKWWAWYGGMYWGPRFFLFASIPASLMIACAMDKASFLRDKVLWLGIAMFSLWVGISGAVFHQSDTLLICSSSNYAMEILCWYVPEFSVLFRPFVVGVRLDPGRLALLAYGAVLALHWGIPLMLSISREVTVSLRQSVAKIRSPAGKKWTF